MLACVHGAIVHQQLGPHCREDLGYGFPFFLFHVYMFNENRITVQFYSLKISYPFIMQHVNIVVVFIFHHTSRASTS